ncbi:MAG: Rrf2 family transcriptional regulator [Candidatus Cloacimonadota bacterium]|nr:MAG: Rrf2 family transcriptional regulator [Candidatus Cloacimonadota bacterium]
MTSPVNFSEGSYLAFHGLALIAQKAPERLSIKSLAKELHASEAHLAKVFQKLGKASFVNSVRGPAGGFVLAKKPEDISFLDIYEVMEGKAGSGFCPFGKEVCVFKTCIFKIGLGKHALDILDSFKKMTLVTLL